MKIINLIYLLGLRSRFGRLVISFVRDAIESSTTIFVIGGGSGSILLSSVVSFMTFSLPLKNLQ